MKVKSRLSALDAFNDHKRIPYPYLSNYEEIEVTKSKLFSLIQNILYFKFKFYKKKFTDAVAHTSQTTGIHAGCLVDKVDCWP